MGHEIVSGLKVDRKNQTVWIKSADSNLYPRTHERWEAKGLAMRYKEHGLEAVTKVILRMYWEGALQEGTPNNFSKAVWLFRLHNPNIEYHSIGEVKHLDLCTCPLEVLPKFLHVSDKAAQEIITSRLAGNSVDPKSIVRPTLYTTEEHMDNLYDFFLEYKNRKKEDNCLEVSGNYLMKRGMRMTRNKDYARIFKSKQDAMVFAAKHRLDIKSIKPFKGD